MYVRTSDGLGQATVTGSARKVKRTNPEYIRWVQQALNKILGLGLKVDGVMGPKTWSAIRTFQRQRGLKVDGIVGPKTEGALIRAGAGRPPGAIKIPEKLPGRRLCDLPEFERLKKHCRDQMKSYIFNCLLQNGVDFAKANDITVGLIALALATAAEIPPAAILAALAAHGVFIIVGAETANEIANCIAAVLRGYRTCISNAKDATQCL